MNSAPCKDCERKGCGSYHDQCPEYLAWKKELNEANEKARAKYNNENVLLMRPKRRRH